MPRGDALAVLACGVTGIKVKRSRYDLTVPKTTWCCMGWLGYASARSHMGRRCRSRRPRRPRVSHRRTYPNMTNPHSLYGRWKFPVYDCFAREVSRVRASCTVPRLQVRPLVSHNEDLNSLNSHSQHFADNTLRTTLCRQQFADNTLPTTI
eukprot:scaffold82375_cov67-Phaeocystis_antarctica.AAC.1